MNSNKKMFIGSAVCFAIFVLFTILVKNVDVMPVGPQFSAVGFASLNKAVAEALDGLPDYKMHCSVLAEEAIKSALDDYNSKS